MVRNEFPLHLLRIYFTVPLWVYILTSRITYHEITFINLPYCSPQDFIPAWLWLNVLSHCLVLSLWIIRMIYSFNLNIPVGPFAQHELCPEFHTVVQVYRRLCFHMLAFFPLVSFKGASSMYGGLSKRWIFQLDLPHGWAWPGGPNFRFCHRA